MKHPFETFCLLGLSAYLAYFAYSNIKPNKAFEVPRETPKVELIKEPIAPSKVVIAPEPIIDPAMVRQDAPPKNLAPEGVFYLIAAKSIETESGITSYRVGTRLTKTQDKYKTDDNVFLDVKSEEISNDLDLVSFVSSIKNAPVAAAPEVQEEPAVVPPLAERRKTPQPVYNNPLNGPAFDKRDFGVKNTRGERKSFSK